MSGTDDDVTGEMPPPEEEYDIDPREAAWFEADTELLEQLATADVKKNANDAMAHAWLGLVQSVTDRVAAGQASIKKAFELLRGELAKATTEEDKHQLTWTLHGIANRLIDSLAENPSLGLPAAHFVADTLKLDHAPSLRLIAEERANREGDVIGAATMLKKALQLDATDPETHYLMARLLARLGKKPNVLSHLKKAIENAAGTISVRTLARFEPDFDGFRKDEEFNELIDTLPKDPVLRPIYAALDAGETFKVAELSPAAVAKAAQKLDVLYPWREALELLLDSGEGDEQQLRADLEKVEKDIDALESKELVSDVYQRFCGDS